jgi:phosphoribosylamine---glycine ligase
VRILVVGSGAREHALAWKLSQSPTVDRLFAAPGNAGLAELATCVPIAAGDVAALVDLVEQDSIDLTVVGPEAPLVAGLADELEARGLRVFGPTRAAARIEGSKAWAKEVAGRAGIATAGSRTFTDYHQAVAYLGEVAPPFVVKADGLASGKGVTVTEDRREAELALNTALVERAFGDAGARVLVEEHLAGREVSFLAVTDGTTVLPLEPAQDHKRVHDGDRGPNTGGMGAYSPVPFVDEATRETIRTDILERAVQAMASEGVRYRGVLYAGLMLTGDGPKLLEFNCRFGDPETQAIVPRLRSDLGELLLACVEGNLASYRPEWSDEACVTVVLASGGYPDDPVTGKEVSGLADAASLPGVHVFHAGTRREGDRVLSSGGRVLAVSGLGDSIEEARGRAYEAAGRISFEGMHYRKDIAAQVEAR